jgi:hypothetical protein
MSNMELIIEMQESKDSWQKTTQMGNDW